MHVIRILAALAIALLAAAPAAASDWSRALPADGATRLRIELDRGEVELRSHDAAQIAVEAGATGLGASTMTYGLEREGGHLVLRGRGERWLDWIRGGPRVRVRVWVPEHVAVEVDRADGAVAVRDVRADPEERKDVPERNLPRVARPFSASHP